MRVSTYRLLVALAAGAGPIVLPAALAQPVAGREASQAAPGGVAGHDWHEVTRRFGGVKADTRPSRDATMKFSVSTEVREVLVQGGQKVK
ncbi:MAG TPA: hypothetical protein VD963_11505, partial [Phycisphaerales bacterium]|nr:hypothetical protein [Phycisphaerales bacterium]